MKFLTFVVLGLGIINVTFSKGLIDYFDYWFGDISDEGGSSEDSVCTFFTKLFGLDYYDNESDDTSDENNEPVHLPGGPSWLDGFHTSRPPASGYRPTHPGQQQIPQKPPAGADQGSPPPLSSSQPLHQAQPQQQEPAQPLFNSSQSIPTSHPLAGIPVAIPPGTSIATGTPEDSLILSTAEDEVDDTDGEGVLVGEEESE